MRSINRLTTSVVGAAVLLGCVSGPAVSQAKQDGTRVLVFSKTAGFHHGSISAGIEAVKQLGETGGFTADSTEDAGAFTADNLGRYDAVVFLSTTGDVLNAAQETAFEGYIRSGGGYVGIHAAADTEYDWAFYGGLVGAYFESHPWWPMRATVHVEDHAHPATADLPTTWNRTDEWYNFRSNPRERVRVLASLDESSYWGGTMNGDHPIAWCQNYQGGRSFYTGVGHSKESFAEPAVRQHLLGAIQWATGAVEADCRPENG
jgi:type 1 glutamine amidotransferase